MRIIHIIPYLMLCLFFLFNNTTRCEDSKLNDDYNKIEFKRIEKYQNLVKRIDQSTLRLEIKSGEVLVLKDKMDPPNHADRVIHSFYKLDDHINCYLIYRELWEENDVLAVNINNGTKYVLPAKPIYNDKSKNRFACFTSITVLLPAIFHIYRFDHNEMLQEYKYVSEEWDIENFSWINDSEINFDFVTYKDLGYTFEIAKKKKMVLRFVNNKWKLENRTK